MFDPAYDTCRPMFPVLNSTRYHPGRWKFMAAKRVIFYQRGWLTKTQDWVDINGISHMVRWEVRVEPAQSR